MVAKNPYAPPATEETVVSENRKLSTDHLGLRIVGILGAVWSFTIGLKLWSIPAGEFGLDGSNRLTLVVALAVVASAVLSSLIIWLGRKHRAAAFLFLLPPVVVVALVVLFFW
ncbi:MAG: hypothetical protein KDB22_29500 [Planctomycetales bacterium]|nr:hypothetical protein [Planctomycetales bacterium]